MKKQTFFAIEIFERFHFSEKKEVYFFIYL